MGLFAASELFAIFSLRVVEILTPYFGQVDDLRISPL